MLWSQYPVESYTTCLHWPLHHDIGIRKHQDHPGSGLLTVNLALRPVVHNFYFKQKETIREVICYNSAQFASELGALSWRIANKHIFFFIHKNFIWLRSDLIWSNNSKYGMRSKAAFTFVLYQILFWMDVRKFPVK